MSVRSEAHLPDPVLQRDIRIHSDFADTENERVPIDVPVRTLSPVSSSAMNAISSSPDRSTLYASEKSRSQNTIRSVPSEIDSSPLQRPRDMPHSIKTLPSHPITSHPPQTHLNPRPNGVGLVRQISSEFGNPRSLSASNYSHPGAAPLELPSSTSNPDILTSPDGTGQPLWSAVGKASLAGKSGKVIERIMAEKDSLKRELTLEKLRAEESRQSVKMAEESKAAVVAEYENKLHDAAINKTLLKRKERQLVDMKAQIEGEKSRADSAVDRERNWREAMERSESASKRAVEEAQGYAALMEGRVNTMTGHWNDQKAEIQTKVGKMQKQVDEMMEIRRQDDKKISTLEGLCDQQKEMLAELERKNQAMDRIFQAYKQEQEDSLRDIKGSARKQEERNEKAIEETLEALGTLKWALNVKKNVDFDKPPPKRS